MFKVLGIMQKIRRGKRRKGTEEDGRKERMLHLVTQTNLCEQRKPSVKPQNNGLKKKKKQDI